MSLEKIKILMKMKGYTSESLSQKSGVPKSTIDKITCGATPDPRYETVKAIANGLDLTVDELAEYLGIDTADNEIHTIAAHHEGDEWTDEELNEIEEFKQFVLSKRNK